MRDSLWPSVPLYEIASDIKDGTHGTHPRVECGIPFLSAKNITPTGQLVWSEDDEFVNEAEYRAITSGFAPKRDDLLVTVVGSLGRTALFNGEKVAFQRSVAFVRPNSRVAPQYLLQASKSAHFLRQMEQRSNATAQAGLYLGELSKVCIPLPPADNQQRIAEILSTADEAIEQTEALIAKTQQIKAGLMHDLFTRGVTPDGQLRPPRDEAPQLYKESPLGWIPKEWEVRSLNEIADVNRGKFTIRPRNDPRYYSGHYPFIQTGDVALAGGRVLTTYSQTLNALGLGVSRLFPAGTIMVTIAANIADTCILGIPMCAPDSLVGVVPNHGEVGRYVELCIRRRKRWFENRAPQTAQKNINLDDLRPLAIPYPETMEQERIAERYEAIDAQVRDNEETAEKLCCLKRGLMADLLTGRVPVSTTAESNVSEVAANV